jgi:lysozyme
MHINDRGLALIKQFEGCELTAYRCPAGILTIGYGSTGKHVKPGMVITQPEAEALLKRDLARFETGVNAMVEGVPTTSDQFSALVSFAFNLGLANLLKSTLLKKHRRADFKGAADEFLRWNRAGNRILAGLTRRRAAERRLYMGDA